MLMKTVKTISSLYSKTILLGIFSLLFAINVLSAQKEGFRNGLVVGALITTTYDLEDTRVDNGLLGSVIHNPGDLRNRLGVSIGYFGNKFLSKRWSANAEILANYSTMRINYTRVEAFTDGSIYRLSEGVARFDELIVTAPIDLRYHFADWGYLIGGLQMGYTLYNGSKWKYKRFNYADSTTGAPITPVIEQREEVDIEVDPFNWGGRIGFGLVDAQGRGSIETVFAINLFAHSTEVEPDFRKVFLGIVLKKNL